MKHAYMFAIGLSFASAFALTPEVSNVTMAQDETRQVTITYNLNSPAVVTLDVECDRLGGVGVDRWGEHTGTRRGCQQARQGLWFSYDPLAAGPVLAKPQGAEEWSACGREGVGTVRAAGLDADCLVVAEQCGLLRLRRAVAVRASDE